MNPATLSIVIPAHNEADSLPGTITNLVYRLEAASVPYEIVVVDDHSSDETARVVKHLAERYPGVRLVHNERPNGFGQAVHTGLDAFRGDAVCLVMADGSDDPDDVVQYYTKLSEGVECVFGSRFMARSKIVNYPRHKLVLNRLANLFIRLLFGLQYNDITNAFKCYRRTVIEGIRPILSHHFNLTVELPLKAIVRGFSYAIVPTNWYGRVHGVSKLRIREMGSRYLFIVLYVLLERLLARGDYRRSDAFDSPTSAASEAEKPRTLGWAWLAFSGIVLFRAFFAYTYPLNHSGGDAGGYYHVLINRTSNLLFAPGYPYLASLPLRLDAVHARALADPVSFHKALEFGQHAVELACLLVLLIALVRIYNRVTAVIAVAMVGCSVQALGVTSSVYPEWLQADLLILALALAALAYSAQSGVRKTALYSLSMAAFCWCVLTKFNAVVLAPVVIAPLIFEKTSWGRRGRMFLAAASFAMANYLFFVAVIHKPATGTYALTHDRSWVLLTKLKTVYGDVLPYADGPASRRWLALSAVLPPSYDVASVGPFMSLDAVPSDVREPARRDAAFLLTSSDDVVDGVLQMHSLPPGFRLDVSSIPISYYIGLAESDELGVQVFLENVLHAPVPYIRSVMRDSLRALTTPMSESTLPTVQNVGGVTERLVPLGDDRFRLERSPESPLPYDSKEPILWGPGFQFFSRLASLPVRRDHVVMVMAFGFVLAIGHGMRYRWSFRAMAPVVLTLFLCAFVMFSNALLAFRWKEWRLALPVAAILIAITLGWAIPELVQVVGRLFSSGTLQREARD